eukprot:Skav202363  [mRNA]  locus=scaffold3817:48134:50614:- [translate_table: standard]
MLLFFDVVLSIVKEGRAMAIPDAEFQDVAHKAMKLLLISHLISRHVPRKSIVFGKHPLRCGAVRINLAPELMEVEEDPQLLHELLVVVKHGVHPFLPSVELKVLHHLRAQILLELVNDGGFEFRLH